MVNAPKGLNKVMLGGIEKTTYLPKSSVKFQKK